MRLIQVKQKLDAILLKLVESRKDLFRYETGRYLLVIEIMNQIQKDCTELNQFLPTNSVKHIIEIIPFINPSGINHVSSQYRDSILEHIDNIKLELTILINFINSLNIKNQQDESLNFQIPEDKDIKDSIEHIDNFIKKFNHIFTPHDIKIKFRGVDSGSSWIEYIIELLNDTTKEVITQVVTIIIIKLWINGNKYYIDSKKQTQVIDNVNLSQQKKDELKKEIIENTRNTWIEDTTKVIIKACKKNNIEIIKGDTTQSTAPEKLVKEMVKSVWDIYNKGISFAPSLSLPEYIKRSVESDNWDLTKIHNNNTTKEIPTPPKQIEQKKE